MSIGFQGAYLVLGIIALSFTLISVFTLSGPGPFSRSFAQSGKQA
jgi:OHS family lactose permease-like MFS transporter